MLGLEEEIRFVDTDKCENVWNGNLKKRYVYLVCYGDDNGGYFPHKSDENSWPSRRPDSFVLTTRAFSQVEKAQEYLLSKRNNVISNKNRKRFSGVILNLDHGYLKYKIYDSHRAMLWIERVEIDIPGTFDKNNRNIQDNIGDKKYIHLACYGDTSDESLLKPDSFSLTTRAFSSQENIELYMNNSYENLVNKDNGRFSEVKFGFGGRDLRYKINKSYDAMIWTERVEIDAI